MYKTYFCDNWTVKDNTTGEKETVTLPHDIMISKPRNSGHPTKGAGGFFAGGDCEYFRNLYVSGEERDRTFVLEFEGIYQYGQIYVNGCFAGSVRGGYMRLLVGVTAYLKYDCENEILVKVTNSSCPNGRWYTGTGLYRPVWLHTGGETRIGVDGLRITTPQVEKDVALVMTKIRLEYDRKETKSLRIETAIKDEKGMVVAHESTPVSIFGEYVPEVNQRIYIANPQLWSDRKPCLYTCEVQVKSGESILDETESTFGIRKITIDPVHGMQVNGETVELRGACIHHDNGPLGAATFNRAEERRVELLKKAGFNAIRSAHNPASRALLDACDRLGMFVLDEAYDMWNQAKSLYDYALDFAVFWERDVEDIVSKDFNHPCVFMYSIGNEIQELGNIDGKVWNRKLANQFHTLDATRFVTNAVNGLVGITDELPQILLDFDAVTPEQLTAMYQNADDMESNGGINDLMTALMGQMNLFSSHQLITDRLEEVYSGLDSCGLNYMREAYEVYHRQFPNRIFYGAETLPPDIDRNWAKVKAIPACLGDFTWTGWDYIGEAGIGVVTYDDRTVFMKDYPVYLAYCGDFDIIGHRRPLSFYREIVYGFRNEPYITVQLPEHSQDQARHTPWVLSDSVSSWTWTGYEGKACKVEVYSDAAEVELLVNGKSYGKKPTGEENRYRAIFEAIYESGAVEAIAYENGVGTTRYKLFTADEKVELLCQPDKKVLEAGKQDLSYVMISLVDENGRLNTSRECKVKVSVEGAGTLQAFASANPKSTENFYDSERTTHYGKALAIVRAGAKSGVITVKAEAEGCTNQVVQIQVE